MNYAGIKSDGKNHVILAPDDDFHARAVKYAAKSFGIEAQIIPSLLSVSGMKAGMQMVGKPEILWQGKPLASVWVRRPSQHVLPFPVHSADRKFAQMQWLEFSRCIEFISPKHSETLWINSIDSARAAESKAFQICRALEVGLRCPPTLMSNDPVQVREFARKHGVCVFKSFTPFIWIDQRNSTRKLAVTKIVTLNDLCNDDSILVAPGIYQPYIEKHIEIRATVVGNQVYAMATHPNGMEAPADWRSLVNDPDAKLDAIDLPANIEDSIRRLMRDLGLIFGCIDLAIDSAGNAWFLEINQAGQFLYVEEKVPSLKLLSAFTSMFCHSRTDYSLPSYEVSLSQYMNTDDYMEWADAYRKRDPSSAAIVEFLEEE